MPTSWPGSQAMVMQGTANDFATGLELPVEPQAALELALRSGDGHPIDIGLVNGQVRAVHRRCRPRLRALGIQLTQAAVPCRRS